jgi:putative addiction module component (TIGR02574 family)
VTRAAKKILDEARALSVEEREEIAHGLLESVAADRDELSPEWREEIRRRIERAERGESKSIPWDEARARLESMFRRE